MNKKRRFTISAVAGPVFRISEDHTGESCELVMKRSKKNRISEDYQSCRLSPDYLFLILVNESKLFVHS